MDAWGRESFGTAECQERWRYRLSFDRVPLPTNRESSFVCLCTQPLETASRLLHAMGAQSTTVRERKQRRTSITEEPKVLSAPLRHCARNNERRSVGTPAESRSTSLIINVWPLTNRGWKNLRKKSKLRWTASRKCEQALRGCSRIWPLSLFLSVGHWKHHALTQYPDVRESARIQVRAQCFSWHWSFFYLLEFMVKVLFDKRHMSKTKMRHKQVQPACVRAS